MASRSRVVQYLAFAALPIVALLSGCATSSQQAFRFPAQAQEKEASMVVTISSDCKADPERAVVSVKLFNRSNPHAQVLWHVVDKQKGDRIVISGGAAQLRDAKRQLLRQIPGVFQSQYDVPESDGASDAIRSGVPNHVLGLLLHPNESIIWKYKVDYYRDGKLLCTRDPDICIRKVGTTECQTN